MYRRRFKKRFISKRKRRYVFKKFAKKVKKAMGSVMEKKYLDTIFPNTNIDNAGALYLLSQPNAGTGFASRTGNKIRGRYLKMNISMYENTATTIFVRVSIVRGRSNNLAIGDCPTSNDSQFWDIEKWHVMYDKVYNLGDTGSDGKNKLHLARTFKIFKDMLYDGNFGTSQVTNPIYLFVWANDALVPKPFFYGSVRFTFSDLI